MTDIVYEGHTITSLQEAKAAGPTAYEMYKAANAPAVTPSAPPTTPPSTTPPSTTPSPTTPAELIQAAREAEAKGQTEEARELRSQLEEVMTAEKEKTFGRLLTQSALQETGAKLAVSPETGEAAILEPHVKVPEGWEVKRATEAELQKYGMYTTAPTGVTYYTEYRPYQVVDESGKVLYTVTESAQRSGLAPKYEEARKSMQEGLVPKVEGTSVKFVPREEPKTPVSEPPKQVSSSMFSLDPEKVKTYLSDELERYRRSDGSYDVRKYIEDVESGKGPKHLTISAITAVVPYDQVMTVWNDMHTADPASGLYYRKADLFQNWGERLPDGSYTGKILWDKFHRDLGASMAWEQVLKSGSVDLEEIKKVGGFTGVEAAQDVLEQFKSLPEKDQRYIQQYGLHAYIDKLELDERQRKDAEAVIRMFDKEGDPVKFAVLATQAKGVKATEKGVFEVLVAAGYSAKDAAQIVKIARDTPRYMIKPEGFAEGVAKSAAELMQKTTEAIDKVAGKLAEGAIAPVAFTPGAKTSEKVVKGLIKGGIDFFTVPVTAVETLTVAGAQAFAKDYLGALETFGSLAPVTYIHKAGKGEFIGFGPAALKAIEQDPYVAVPENIVLFAPIVAKGVTSAISTVKGTKAILSPHEIHPKTVTIEMSVPSAVIPDGMVELAARQKVESAILKTLTGGTDFEATAAKALRSVSDAIEQAHKFGHDVVIKDAEGKVAFRLTPANRFEPTLLYKVVPDATFVQDAVEAGMPVEVKGRSGIAFWSLHAPLSFVSIFESPTDPAVLATRVTWKDIKPLPRDVINQPTLSAMYRKMMEMVQEGKLEKGFYPVFKRWQDKIELELVSTENFPLQPVRPTWYTQPFRRGVATDIDLNSMLKQLKDDKHIVFDLDYTLVDGNGRPYRGAKQLIEELRKQGKEVSLWTHSERARAEGLLRNMGLDPSVFKNFITREDYEPTGLHPYAYKDISKIGGDRLVDDSKVQKSLQGGKQLYPKLMKVETPSGIAAMRTYLPHKFIGPDGKVLKEGTAIPLYFLLTDSALKEGRTLPTSRSLMLASAFTLIHGLRELASWRPGHATFGYYGGKLLPFYSTLRALEFEAADTISAPTRHSALITNERGEVLLVRQKGTDRYDLPGGSELWKQGFFKRRENQVEALRREISEETGLESKRMDYLGRLRSAFDVEPRTFDIYRVDTEGAPRVRSSSKILEYVWWDGKSPYVRDPVTGEPIRVAKFVIDAMNAFGSRKPSVHLTTVNTSSLPDTGVGAIVRNAIERYKEALGEEFETFARDVERRASDMSRRTGKDMDECVRKVLDEELRKSDISREALESLTDEEREALDEFRAFNVNYILPKLTSRYAVVGLDELDLREVPSSQVSPKEVSVERVEPLDTQISSIARRIDEELPDLSPVYEDVRIPDVEVSDFAEERVPEGERVPPPEEGVPPEGERVPPPEEGVPPEESVPPKLTVPPEEQIPPAERTPPPPLTPPSPEERIPPPAGGVVEEEKVKGEEPAPVAWRQGFGWWVIKPPYQTNEDIYFVYGDDSSKLPAGVKLVRGGPGSAYRAIQALGYVPASEIKLDLGFQDVIIRRPSTPGRPGAITYIPDRHGRTRHSISVTRGIKQLRESAYEKESK